MGWFTLTGEADTDITAGSLGASGAFWDRKKSNSQHESKTLRYRCPGI